MIKKIKDIALMRVIPTLGYFLINLIHFTCKKRYHIARIPDSNCIFIFWHGEILMLPKLQKFFDKKGHKFALVISDHKDGELISRIVSKFGIKSIRGSTSKGSIKALKNMIKMSKDGYNIGITPDGPRGPSQEIVSDGAIYLAKKLNLPIICINYRASRAIRMRSWDRFAVPYPFSTLDYYISDSCDVTDMSVESAKLSLKKELMQNAF